MDRPRVVIVLDNGRIDNILSDVEVEVRALYEDISACDEDEIVRIEEIEFGCSEEASLLDEDYVNEVFKKELP